MCVRKGVKCVCINEVVRCVCVCVREGVKCVCVCLYVRDRARSVF